MPDRSARKPADPIEVDRAQAELARWLAEVAERAARRRTMGGVEGTKRGGEAA